VLWATRWTPRPADELSFEQVPFDHPLWVLYSSGTTGLPKAIVQATAGSCSSSSRSHNLHVDAQEGDRVFWFSTTGWMMWNFLVGVLLTDASIVLYDGSPGHPTWTCSGISPRTPESPASARRRATSPPA
jgi:acetoacetyl-CoA synthetase